MSWILLRIVLVCKRIRNVHLHLDMAIMRLALEASESAALVSLTGVYHNLLRMWAEP